MSRDSGAGAYSNMLYCSCKVAPAIQSTVT